MTLSFSKFFFSLLFFFFFLSAASIFRSSVLFSAKRFNGLMLYEFFFFLFSLIQSRFLMQTPPHDKIYLRRQPSPFFEIKKKKTNGKELEKKKSSFPNRKFSAILNKKIFKIPYSTLDRANDHQQCR